MRLIVFLLLIAAFQQLQAITLYARQDADWDQPSAWSNIGPGGASCGCIPAAGDDVIIDGYDIVIDVNTGSVTVNSLIIRSDGRDDAALLRIEDGMRLTISGNLTIFGNRAGRSQTLNMINANTRLVIGGDLILDQNTGDDIILDIEDSGRIDIADDVLADKDGGDDIDFRLNENSGSTASITVADDFSMTIDNFDLDGVRFLINGASSKFTVTGDLSISANTAANDVGVVLFDLNAGTFSVGATATLTRADDCGNIDMDMDGGNFVANAITVNSSGTLFGNTGVRFFVDAASQLNVAGNMNVTMTAGDDFFLFVNENAGTSAQINIGGNLSITRSDGDDIELRTNADNSRIDINGNLSITSTGGENIIFDLNNDSQIDIAGNLSITQTGGDLCSFTLEGGGDNPLLNVGSNCSLTNAGGNNDFTFDIDGGVFAVGNACTINLNTGGDDVDIFLDGNGQITSGGDFVINLNGGDDIRVGLGENTTASTARLDVAGHLQLIHNRNNAGATFYLRVFDNTEVEAAELTLSTAFSAAPAFLTDVNNNAVLDVDGDINLIAPAAGELELRVSASSTVQLMGNIVRAAVPNKFGEVDFSATGTLLLNGNAPQILASDAGSGGDFVSYYNVIVNNTFASAPQITMEGLATINNNLNLIDGVIATTSTNIIVLPDNATASSASDASYVDGPLRKIGDDAFAFPLGDDGNYQAIYISAPAVTTDAFEAQYFETDPDVSFDDASKVAAIDHISSCEYWILNRTAGTSNVSVSLTWDPNSCGVTLLNDLLVARWNGTQWVNEGNGGTSGTITTGTIVSAAAVSAFSPFTLGSSASGSNPLPIELLSFTAQKNNRQVVLDWQTATEKNNHYFQLEKSNNGLDWEPFATLQGKGTSTSRNQYQHTDTQPHQHYSYYRLKQVDFDGSFSYSNIVAVYMHGNSEIKLYPNPADEIVFISGVQAKLLSIALISNLGQRMDVKYSTTEQVLSFYSSQFQTGAYILELVTATEVIHIPLVIL